MKLVSYVALTISSLSPGLAAVVVQKCCDALSKTVSKDKIYFPQTTPYNDRIGAYWSVSSALAPWCIVLPSATEDVSLILRTLTDNQCPFGIISGGHAGFPLANSVEEGVTIDLGNMNATTYDPDTKVASIQPGSRWKPVYDTLEEQDVVVTGGRVSDVGVSGLLTGGGNSFHTAEHGWACDNVVNYEVVLADGSVVNANVDENADLWVALKGSSGNLGVVTRFDMSAFEYPGPDHHIYGGLVTFNYSETDAVIDAFVRLTDNTVNDPYSSTITFWGYIPALGGFILHSELFNTINEASSPGLDAFLEIPEILTNGLRSAPMTEITDTVGNGPGYRNIWMDAAYANDPHIMKFAIEKFEDIAPRIEAALPSDSVVDIDCMFQPLTQSAVSHSAPNGGNVLGLEERVKDGNGMIFLAQLQVRETADELTVLPLMREWVDAVDEYATSLDLNWNWRYLNYAYPGQDPIGSYGAEAVAKIRAASAKYDPDGVFQKLRGSGFKIPVA